jgi:hypothetical protein
MLANLYLHYVLDLWVNRWRRKKAVGDVIIVRYADDAVLGFQHRTEAVRFLEELGKRVAKFGLELHPEKTRFPLVSYFWFFCRHNGVTFVSLQENTGVAGTSLGSPSLVPLYPCFYRRDLGLAQAPIIGPLPVMRIGLPRGHVPAQDRFPNS